MRGRARIGIAHAARVVAPLATVFSQDSTTTSREIRLLFSAFDDQGNDITNTTTVTYQPPVNTLPEPTSLTLLATGLAGVASVARRKWRAALGSN